MVSMATDEGQFQRSHRETDTNLKVWGILRVAARLSLCFFPAKGHAFLPCITIAEHLGGSPLQQYTETDPKKNRISPHILVRYLYARKVWFKSL